MSVAIRAITRVQDADDAPTLGAGQDGYALTWNNATGKFVATALPAAGLATSGAVAGATSQRQVFQQGIELDSGAGAGKANWNFVPSYTTWYSERNNVAFWGWNATAPGVSFPDPSDAALYIGFESNYKIAEAGPIYLEWYVEAVNAGNTISVRPYQANVDRDTMLAINQFTGRLVWRNNAATKEWQITEDGAVYTDSKTRITVNNIQALEQKNAAGTQYPSLIYLNSSDNVVLGGYHVNAVQQQIGAQVVGTVNQYGFGVFATPSSGAIMPVLALTSGAGNFDALNALAQRTDATGYVFMNGVMSTAKNVADAASSDITVAIGLRGNTENQAASGKTASMQYSIAVAAGAPAFAGAGTKSIGNASGLFVYNQGASGITYAHGIQIEAISGAIVNYSIYSAGGTMYHAGNIGIGANPPASRLDIGAGALTMSEMTAPSAPAANGAVIYAEDNGAGKTKLMVRFASGVAQQIAIEP